MTEVAALDNWQGAEPVTVVMNMPTRNVGSQYIVFFTDNTAIWRPRVVTISGTAGGAPGSIRLGLNLNFSAFAGQPWTNSSNATTVSATVAQDILAGNNFQYTWSTESQSTYFSFSDQWGYTAQAGLPLVYLPAGVSINVEITKQGGYAGGTTFADGFMLIEKFPVTTVVPGPTSEGGNVYLLPSVI